MFDQPPFPLAAVKAGAPFVTPSDVERGLGVIVPTRDRPDRLRRCLDALAAARGEAEFRVYVCDSSSPSTARRVAELCSGYPFVELVSHDRVGAAAARNVGTESCREELIVALDDDVYVEPGAIGALLRAYRQGAGTRVVAGSVIWRSWTSKPLVLRRIGFARDARFGEEVEFVVSALVLYPRALGLACPWNERLWPYDDRFASLLWRVAGAELLFTPDALASHDPMQNDYPVTSEADRVYTNLFDAVFVSRSPARGFFFELLGFAAAAKKWARTPRGGWTLFRAWAKGHVIFLRDFRRLRNVARDARASRGNVTGREPGLGRTAI